MRGAQGLLEPGTTLRGLRLDASDTDVLEFRIDVALSATSDVRAQLFRPSGRTLQLRTAKHGAADGQVLDQDGIGRFTLRSPGRYHLKCTVDDLVSFETIEVPEIEGRRHSILLRPTPRRWHEVVLEDLPSSVQARTTLFDEDGGVIWKRAHRRGANRLRVPVAEGGWTLRTEEKCGRERTYVASARQIAEAEHEPLRLQASTVQD